MTRKVLNFNSIPYLIEHRNSSENFITKNNQFVMLRRYDIMNNIAIDKEIYFISIDDYQDYLSYVNDEFIEKNNICFPVINGEYKAYYSDILSFMNSSTLDSLVYENDEDKDYYILRNEQGEPIDIPCDEIRIYKPHNRKNTQFIIDISNLINDIHFHYLCKIHGNEEVKVCTEISEQNSKYYEYISIYIPSIEYLFHKDLVKYREDLNLYETTAGLTSSNFCSLSNMLLPYKIEKACSLTYECKDCPLLQPFEEVVTITPWKSEVKINIKANGIKCFSFIKKIKEEYNDATEYAFANVKYVAIDNGKWELDKSHKIIIRKFGRINTPINFEFEVEGADIDKTSIYDPAGELCRKQTIRNVFIKSYKIEDILSKEYVNTDYNHNNVPLIVSFNYFDDLDNNTKLYLDKTGVSSSSSEIVDDLEFKLATRVGFDYYNKSIISIISEWQYPKLLDENNEMSLEETYFYLNKIENPTDYWNFKGYDDEYFLENFSDEFIEGLKFNTAGYVIELSRDRRFEFVFYRKSTASKSIDDFTFNLNDIFDNWNDYPDVIFVRTIFIDKYLSKVFYGNTVVLTKEKFKYCLNDSANIFRLDNFKDFQKPLNRIPMQVENIFFVDKINCSVKKHDITNEQFILGGGTGNSAIAYKTVFFKTHDLQNIRIRKTVTQKLGINLEDYLSKVQNFKMKIDGYEFTETERHDVYVIFTIPGAQLLSVSGTYDIVNEEDEYISSGNYIVY